MTLVTTHQVCAFARVLKHPDNDGLPGCSGMMQESARDRQKGEATPELQVCGIPFAKNPHAMWIYDRETLAFLEVNDAAIHKYGYSRAEFLALTIADIRPQEDVPELMMKTHVRGAATGLVVRHCTKHGAVVPVSITSWQLTFRDRPAELVLARWEAPV